MTGDLRRLVLASHAATTATRLFQAEARKLLSGSPCTSHDRSRAALTAAALLRITDRLIADLERHADRLADRIAILEEWVVVPQDNHSDHPRP